MSCASASRASQLRTLGLHFLVHQAAPGKNKRFLTPDRGVMTMDRAFLRAYSLLLIRTCHRRGAFAMGGMAAQIPVRGDAVKNEAAFTKVRQDKERELRATVTTALGSRIRIWCRWHPKSSTA